LAAGRTCHGHPPFPGTPGAPGSLADVVEEASVCWSWHSHSMIMSPNAVKMKAVASALRLDPTPYTDLVWHGASAFLECWQLGVQWLRRCVGSWKGLPAHAWWYRQQRANKFHLTHQGGKWWTKPTEQHWGAKHPNNNNNQTFWCSAVAACAVICLAVPPST
jgi:hypothetical protein